MCLPPSASTPRSAPHRLQVAVLVAEAAVAPAEPDVLDGRAVDDLVEALAAEVVGEYVALHLADPRVVVVARARQAVERHHVVAALRGCERQEADVGTEVERRAGPVGHAREAERPLHPAVALQACAGVRVAQPVRRLSREVGGDAEDVRAATA